MRTDIVVALGAKDHPDAVDAKSWAVVTSTEPQAQSTLAM